MNVNKLDGKLANWIVPEEMHFLALSDRNIMCIFGNRHNTIFFVPFVLTALGDLEQQGLTHNGFLILN